MRASRSRPRSSVPNGCFSDGEASRAVKSMSLMPTFQNSGPSRTSNTINTSSVRPTEAILWRRKRRLASAHAEVLRRARACAGSAVSDTGIEPAIEQVGDQVEQDDEAREHERDRHDHGCVVAQDRIDQQRTDARYTEDLLGDDGAAEDDRHLQC